MKDKHRGLRYGVLGALLLVAGLLAGRWWLTPPQDPALAALGGLGGPFTLQGADGPVALSDFDDRVIAIYFGYTYCPDVCPTTLSLLAQALQQLDEGERARIQGLLVSVDPERDTPARLREYAAFFHPSFIGVTGSEAQLAAVTDAYGVFFRKVELSDSALGYSVDHTSNLYLVNSRGELLGLVRHAAGPEPIRAALKEALARL